MVATRPEDECDRVVAVRRAGTLGRDIQGLAVPQQPDAGVLFRRAAMPLTAHHEQAVDGLGMLPGLLIHATVYLDLGFREPTGYRRLGGGDCGGAERQGDEEQKAHGSAHDGIPEDRARRPVRYPVHS